MVTYFIQMGDYVKIGKTQNLHSRIHSLKTGFPLDLVLLAVCDIPEKEAHQIAETMTKRKNGEWFELNLPILAWIKSLPQTKTEWANYRYKPFNPNSKSKYAKFRNLENRIRRNISISEDIWELAVAAAKKEHISFSAWVERLHIRDLKENGIEINSTTNEL